MVTPTIKAIETRYAGCRFRSRLEARWAVFFDALGIPWEHEAQGFLIDGQRYLPDFHLRGKVCRGQDIAVEVKGVLTGGDLQKILLLALTGQQVLLLQGIPHEGTGGPDFWLFRRTLAKGNAIGLEAVTVGFYPMKEGAAALFPFGWPLGLSEQILDDAATRDRLAAEVIEGSDLANRNGWARVPTAVATAYRAARQARFEHGENGAAF